MRTLALAFLAAADVRAVHTTADGALWLGTGDDGVIRLRGDAEDRWFDGPAVVLFANRDTDGAWDALGVADALGGAEVFAAAKTSDDRVLVATSASVVAINR